MKPLCVCVCVCVVEMTKRLCTFTQARMSNSNQERIFASLSDMEMAQAAGAVEKDRVSPCDMN